MRSLDLTAARSTGRRFRLLCTRGGLPAQVIGVPVPVLDEDAEMFWWDSANYFRMSVVRIWHPGDSWDFAYMRAPAGVLDGQRRSCRPALRRSRTLPR
jgi:hypothetical protein